MKKAFRNNALRALRSLTVGSHENSDRAVALHLDRWCQALPSSKGLNCALFLGMGHEIRTTFIDEVLKNHDITRFYPRTEGRQMTFHAVPEGFEAADMPKGPYGIPEPPPNWLEGTSESLDLVLVPAIAVTAQGHRMGQGGGFYDRFMAHCRKQAKAPLFVALVMDEQILEEIPTDPWDQPIDGILSPLGSKWISNPRSFYRKELFNLLPRGL